MNARLTFAHRLELIMDGLQRGLAFRGGGLSRRQRECTHRPEVPRALPRQRQAGAGRPLLESLTRPMRNLPLGGHAIVELRRRRLTPGAHRRNPCRVQEHGGSRALALGPGCRGLVSLSPPSPLCATSILALGSCSIWTPTSSHTSIERLGHRITGHRRCSVAGAGWGVSLRGHR